MKKLLVLIATLSLFAVACKSNTTIDTTGVGADVSAQTTSPTPGDTDDTGDAGDTASQQAEPSDEAEPTAVPTRQPTAVAQDAAAPTTVATAAPTSAPVAPAPGAAEAIRAVAEADDWCEAASAVEDGTGALDTLNFTDPVLLEQGLTQALAVITASKRLVPNQIAGDLDQSIEAFTTLLTALDDVEWSFLDLDLSIIEELDGPMELATYNIEAYNFNECGIGTDPGLPPVISEDGTVEGSDDLPEFEGTVRDQAVLGLVQAGFTEAEAECIFENLDITDLEALASDFEALFQVFTDCDISLDRLSQLGGG